MNILPKKRWHVRTKANIARVRKDEKEAAELEEKLKQRKVLADQEARRDRLLGAEKQCSLAQSADLFDPGFLPNKDVRNERRREQEKFEKSIGLLTYLGQSLADSKVKHPWYTRKRVAENGSNREEIDLKSKKRDDPIWTMNRESGKSLDLDEDDGLGLIGENGRISSIGDLRRERLEREKEERKRADLVMAKAYGAEISGGRREKREEISYRNTYNSQFNPELTRQNYLARRPKRTRK